MFEREEPKIFVVTLQKVIERLSTVENCNINKWTVIDRQL